MARLHGAGVVLGSATPSMEAFYRAEKGQYQLFTLKERLTGGTLPIVHTVDLREELKNGKIGMYGNVTVKLSNNVAKTEGGDVDNIMIRTKRAIAFVNPLTHTEAYRPEKSFADAVKGYALFDGKVVRPKEIININVKYQ